MTLKPDDVPSVSSATTVGGKYFAVSVLRRLRLANIHIGLKFFKLRTGGTTSNACDLPPSRWVTQTQACRRAPP
jgi:hypothetical protein